MTEKKPSRFDSWLVQTALSPSVPVGIRRRARAWVETRPAARSFYDKVASTASVLDGGMPQAQKDLVEGALFANWTPDGLEETQPAGTTKLTSRVPLFGAIAAACAALLMVTQLPDDDILQARGSGADGALGVTFSCLVGDEGGYRVDRTLSVGSDRTVGALQCPTDAILSLAGTNLRKDAKGVFVVGVDDHGDVHWMAPFDAESPAQTLPANVRASSFDIGVPLTTLAGQRLTFHVLLDDDVVSHADVRASLDAAERKGVRLESLARLPVDVTQQARLHLEVALK